MKDWIRKRRVKKLVKKLKKAAENPALKRIIALYKINPCCPCDFENIASEIGGEINGEIHNEKE